MFMKKVKYDCDRKNVKTLRLTDSMATMAYNIAKEENLTESEFLRKLIEKGLKEYKLGMALKAYKNKEVNIAGGANLAGITYREFLDALEECGIPTIEVSPETLKYGFESMERSLGIKPKKRDYNKLFEDTFINKGKKK
jgi:2-iminoacetate synthase ThiH